MKLFKKVIPLCLLALALVITITALTPKAQAATEDSFTYSVSGGKATITGYTGSATTLTIPSTLGGYAVTSIGDNAFSCCYNLQSITIPDNVTSIGDYAFSWCSSLQSITIPDNVTSIGDSAFERCYSLQSITIPDGVTSIGDSAFSDCIGLQSITIPDSVTSIGDSAFYFCECLQSITIPDSVTSIGRGAFSGCSNLKNVYYGGTQTKWKAISIGSENSNLTNATIHYNHTHDYSLILPVVVEPGCTANGYIEYTCMYGETYGEVLPALGHSTGADAVVIAPTCTEQGYTRSTCSRCGVTITTDYTDALGHDYSGDVVATVAPTCTEDGYNQVQCIRCDSVAEVVYTNALGHNVVTIPLREATCTQQGVSKVGTMCDRCQEVFMQPTYTPVLGHSYTDGVCSRCGKEAADPSAPAEPESVYEAVCPCHGLTVAQIDAITEENPADAKAWVEFDGTALADGVHYRLNSDLTLTPSATSAVIMVAGEKSMLNLNGHNITVFVQGVSRRLVHMAENCQLTICGNGEISGNGNGGGVVYMKAGAVLNLYEATLTNSKVNGTARGGVIVTEKPASGETATYINMYSGTMNAGAHSSDGGCISLSAYGQFNMYGGILNGTTNEVGKKGGALYTTASTCKVNIYGGTINGGNNTGDGSAICMYSSPSLNIEGGVINGIVHIGSATPGAVTLSGNVVIVELKLVSGATIALGEGGITGGSVAVAADTGVICEASELAEQSAAYISSVDTSLDVFVVNNQIWLWDEPPKPIIASGTCGDNLTWELDTAGTLTISGTGAMYDWTDDFSSPSGASHPWKDVAALIENIIIEPGVTTIGNFAFFGLDLQSITVPDSVTSVGHDVFYGDTILQYNIYDNAKYVGNDNNPYLILVEATNYDITSCRIHDDTKIICGFAFAWCSSLQSVTIPVSVATIGYAFYDCYSLEDVYYAGTQTQWNTIIGSFNSGKIHYNHTHDYTFIAPVTVQPTCTENGYIEYTCMYGETYREVIPALGHSAGTDAVIFAPTCTEQGYTQATCTRCGIAVKTDYTDALGHDYTGPEMTVDATCTQEGHSGASCTRCDAVRQDRVIAALGHNVVAIQLREATCTEQGIAKAGTMCDRCQEVFIQPTYTPALGHAYVDHAGQEPTCTEGGWSAYQTCERCDFNSYQELSALGHRVGSVVEQLVDPCVIQNTEFAFSNGTYYSQNHADDSASQFTIVAEHDFQLTLTYGVESEGNYDFLTILLNGVQQASVSGNYSNQVLHLSLQEGDVVTIRYSKDSSQSRGDDQGWVSLEFDQVLVQIDGYVPAETLTPDCVNAVICSCCGVVVKDTIDHNYADGICTVCGAEDPDHGVVAQGKCGDNLTWVLDQAGTLTISGTGAMYDWQWQYDDAPWDSNNSAIESVVIQPGVTSIGSSAFEWCSGLTSVVIPDGVTAIGDCAFGGCSGLTSIVIPDSVTTVGSDAFFLCTSLTDVYITDIVAWCNISFSNSFASPFFNSGNLYLNDVLVTELVIPDNVTSLGDCAFYHCSSLRSITIGNGVHSIGWGAFLGCSSLQSVTIIGDVTNIDGCAFYDCTSLESITIPDSVTTIGSEAFSYCDSLTSITIPDSVTTIGNGAFKGCESLTDIYYTGTEEQWNAITIGSENSCLTNATIHYGYIGNQIPGDFTEDGKLDNNDVLQLLWHTLFANENPIHISGDLNGDGYTDNQDVLKLLWYCLFPEENPL